jgi:DNA-binding response OmpR family regulator
MARADRNSGLRLRASSQPRLVVAIPQHHDESGVVDSVRSCLSGPFPDLFASESPADCPPFIVLVVLIDGWGEFGLLHAVQRCHEGSIATLALSTDSSCDLGELLEAGASDAVHWPIARRELIARVGARLRRSGGPPTPSIRIDAAIRALICHDLTIQLTRSQFAILRMLFKSPGQWVSSRDLMNIALRSNQDDNVRLRVQIHRLREKLERHAWRLQSDREFGYRFNVSDSGVFVKEEHTEDDDRRAKY